MKVLRLFTGMQIIGLVVADYCLWQFFTHADTFGSKYMGGVVTGLLLASLGTAGQIASKYATARQIEQDCKPVATRTQD
jgi:hypothetical protein